MLPVIVDGKFLKTGNRRFFVKGVTYGTFASREGGEQFPSLATVRRDFDAIARAGFNTVRVYTRPSETILDAAADQGLRVIAGIPWTQHVAFLDDRSLVEEIRRQMTQHVRALATHPAVLMFALGNEIPQSIVRWHGRTRVERFLRDLCDEARGVSPTALFTYVNYPPTSYLDLPTFDVCSFNVYLHDEQQLRAYLVHLQNLAGQKPLLLAEAGADSIREGLRGQACITSAHVRAAFEEGACGAVAFAWTDEWWRGGTEIADWHFGLVDRDRRPKPALTAVSRAFADAPFSPEARASWPRVSVVVCAYNAASTLGECLASLGGLDYPDFEVIAVNDGSSDGTGALLDEWIAAPDGAPVSKRVIHVPNSGLSTARNIGLEHATGNIVAYTDADVRVDSLWLAYLVQPFIESDVVGSGGPNVVPPDDPGLAQCVARSPGAPTHVLLEHRIAEHVPGCNMAFRRDRLLAIGGFNPIYVRAGDDVDVCWRLQERGWRIGFAPAAMVWHRHRSSIRAYWRQQVGYGEGEAWLARQHPAKFIGGDMLWRGRIYSSLPFVRALYRDRVHTGVWGTAAFPSIYNLAASGLMFVPASAGWLVLACALIAIGALLQPFYNDAARAAVVLGSTGLLISIARCLRFALQADFPRARFHHRLVVAALHLIQPLARLRGRIGGHFQTPADLRSSAAATTVRALPSLVRALALTAGVRLERKFWTETWTSLPTVLSQLVDALRRQRGAGRIDVDDGWSQHWDVALLISGFGRLEVRAVVEEHARGACLLRTSTRLRPTGAGIAALLGLASAILVAMLLEQSGHNSGSLAVVLCCAFALLWGIRRIVLASARVGAAVDDVVGTNLILPIGEGPARLPALASIAAGALQAALVIAVGTFFVFTAAPTVWDAADDYFPARAALPAHSIAIQHESATVETHQPVDTAQPLVSRVKPRELRPPKSVAAPGHALSRRPAPPSMDRRRT